MSGFKGQPAGSSGPAGSYIKNQRQLDRLRAQERAAGVKPASLFGPGHQAALLGNRGDLTVRQVTYERVTIERVTIVYDL